jgi:hypothetical protein
MADESRSAGNAVFGLNDARRGEPAQGGAGTGSGGSPQPQYVYVQPPASASSTKALWALVMILLAVSGFNLYLLLSLRHDTQEAELKQADQLSVLTRRMDASDDRYAQLRGQFQVTSEKLGLTQQELSRARMLAANIQQQQQAAVKQLSQAIAQKAGSDELNKLQADANAKFTGVSNDISGLNQKLNATNEALNGAKGELSGAIAKTHDELVALAHRTDRDYFEFNLPARRARQKVGTVTVELEKTNPKKNQFSVYLYFDDKRTERKDQAVDSPVYFYVQGAPSPLELVVNKVGKNSVSGYLSAPKGFFAGVPNVLTARPGS